ncbi:MAG: hypothetical protein ACOYB2_10960 [Limnohabitans sp.]
MWSTVIQRPGHASHTVEERVDTRNGGTYLWCDCGAWKFQVSKGGCAHVKLAREQQAAGTRRVDTPMTPEQRETIAAAEAAVTDRPSRAAPSSVPRQSRLDLPILPMLCEKVAAPKGTVNALGVEDDASRRWPILTRQDVAYEPKWDGHRMIVEARNGNVRLWARSQRDTTASYVEIAEAFRFADGVFDGEVIVLDVDGEHRFNALQNIGSLTKQQRSDRLRFVAWDVLEANGEVVMNRPYVDRRAILEDAQEAMLGPWAKGTEARVVLSPSVRDGVALWNAVLTRGLEGVIVKPLRSTWKSNDRGIWTKLKCLRRSDMIVVGYTSGLADHGNVVVPFGALVLAEYDGEELRYAGKVGTGFTQTTVEQVLDTLRPFETATPPWANAGTVKKVLMSVGPRKVTWVRPTVEVVVEYQERGADGVPRFPSFKGMAGMREEASA